jgi:hypothetical protein
VPLTRQQPSDQPPAQAAAHHGKIVSPGRTGVSGMHNGVHDDDASSADAAERTEHSTEIEIGRNARFEPWLHARRTKHISGTKPRREIGESGLGAHYMRLLCQPILEETGNAAVSGNFPRRYYPDRVQRDSLSLAARFSIVSRRQTRAEAPLFRHRSLKHKSETTRKRGRPA